MGSISTWTAFVAGLVLAIRLMRKLRAGRIERRTYEKAFGTKRGR
ncbi:MAG TPA: hypothetical protein VN709_11245 [Terriglobales bacterium]|nr:hypothetical protein [Terriglobales bacterium]